MIKRLLTLVAAAAAISFGASADTLPLPLNDLGSGWDSSYDAATKTITFDEIAAKDAPEGNGSDLGCFAPPKNLNVSSTLRFLLYNKVNLTERVDSNSIDPPNSPAGKKAPVQQRRPLPAAETGRSCWGRGQQDTSAAQGTKWTLGTATRLSEAASFFPFRLPHWNC